MRNNIIHIFHPCLLAIAMLCLVACSTTSHLEEGEQLYTGMKKTVYENYEHNQHFIDTQAEMEAALACAPNGALFGSSYYRTPFPYGLWVYNAFCHKKGALAKWLTQTIGKAPVLMESVNPELRVSVGENVLQNNGYFRGEVSYKLIEGKIGTTKHDTIPRALTGKVAYTVNLGPLYRLDSIEYKGFSDKELELLNSTPAVIKKGDPFSVAKLDEERTRIYDAFKDNGYYFFEKNYITYMADTLNVPEHVQLQVCKVDSLPEDALRQWKIGKTTFRIRHQMMEQPTDTMTRRSLIVEYAGKSPAVRPRVVLQDLQLRPRKLFSQADLTESMSRLTSKGIFSSTEISFNKVDDTFSTDSLGTLNMLVDCTLDKPYDFSLSANYTQKTSGRSGPGVGVGFAIRNAFHGGEVISLNLKGAMEFQIGNKVQDRNLNYDMGADITLQMPRLLLPKFLRPHRRWYVPPSTLFTLSYNRINRSGYFRRNIFASEISYLFKPTERSTHTFTPLSISHTRMASISNEYYNKMYNSGVGYISMTDEYFTPKLRYTYNYTTRSFHANPISLSLTAAEAGNITTGVLSLLGGKQHIVHTLNDFELEEDAYTLFKTPVTQYVRLEADMIKSWRISPYSKLLARCFLGYIKAYGNSKEPPFAELYYSGGANDLRGFSSRGVGPGDFIIDDSSSMYIMSNGDFKFTFNLEYRPRLFGSLYGALFIDAGNVWASFWKDTEAIIGNSMSFKIKNLPNEIAVDAGVGIRYDLDFFVIRLDWGFIVHAPYETGKSGYFNFPSFKKGQCLNFAIGYPF